MWKNFEDTKCIECLNFSSVLRDHKTGTSLNTAIISEGNKTFTHHVVRLY